MVPICTPAYAFLRPLESTSQMAFWSLQLFLHSDPILYSGRPISPQNCPFACEALDCHLIHGSLGPPKSTPKRHINWFSHFCRAHGRHRHTDWRTDHATRSVTIGYIRSTAMRPNNNNNIPVVWVDGLPMFQVKLEKAAFFSSGWACWFNASASWLLCWWCGRSFQLIL